MGVLGFHPALGSGVRTIPILQKGKLRFKKGD